MSFLKHNWVALLFVAALVFFAVDAHTQTVNNEKASVGRSLDACRRGNPGRAYLQLRALEFVKTDLPVKQSYTTTISPLVFAVLNCQRSVAAGHPVPLPKDVQAGYLSWFEKGYVAVVRDTEIVGKIPFDVYFSGAYEDSP